ncbi:uncharacterized protein LOC110095145 [Dendrobium catenatum]|uniref:uncharacterized protein LOC110095145 n=1 Tax=Dendrobium catenatum TaxID=906689 RepID=UPI00109FF3D5|nr:uncharacterized protein LOC110095145 [Dendrobium catenatum]
MAEWFIGPIMDKIINTCSDYLEDQVGWQTGMKEELESLRQNHPKIQAVVFAANQAQISDQNHPINKWIWQLRDAVDEADDVLDEFEYMKHKEQLTKKMEETDQKRTAFANSNFLIESASKIRKVGERALKIDPNLKRLEEVVQKLDKVSVGVSTFLHLLDSAKQEQQEQLRELSEARETGSLPTNDLIGRGEAKEFVMQWLRKPSNEHRGTDLYRNISLLCIVGHGGMGKTTLLQHVYEDEMTKEFDLKMWVCISNNFDVKKVIADMLESLKKERPHLETLEALQDSLRTEIMSKKFLLVLDDIWEEEENRDIRKWEKVFAPLAYGKIGSRILITTRMDSVAMMIAKVIKKKTKIFRLEGLEEDHCLQLLNSHAFADVENPNDYKRLRSIAGEIVKKLLGSPLAAKVIGGVLNSSLDERHWTKVLNSDFVSSKLGQDDIFLILRLSYMFLPKHLQNCFAFCSIFKQDYPFLKDDLVKMWIALGFIQQPHDQEWTMEDIGGMYFDVLVKKSFFDMFEDFGRRYYKLHDLIHELAQSVSIHECLRVEDGKKLPSIIPKTLRHLSVQNTNPDIIKMIGQFKYLHSLFLFNEGSNQDLCNQDLCNALIKIFKASRSLRLLNIWVPKNLEIILKEIGNFLHLRYLRIYVKKFTMLPRSLSNIYHLQYIIYDSLEVPSQSEVHDFLPSDINNLSNLRYLKFPENCISSICGIGKLKSLQELNMFDVRDVNGYRIVELENLNDLWKLRINCLENVKDAEEACSAKLCAKMRLIDLTLCWSNTDSRNIDLEEKVLDNLQPPKCLRNLSIKKYMGASSAIWMNNVNPIFNLEKIKLTYCLKCETLPPFGQLPFLKSLTLSNMPKVKWLESKFNGNDKYHAFPSLEVLHISWLTTLEDWFEAGVAAEDGCLFPCLIQLEIENCPKLEELPSLPSKLKSLKIRKIRWKTMNFCSNSNPIPLELLEVSLCPNITSLPLADEIGRLAALRSLTITKCPNLISLGEMQTTNNCHLILSTLFISDPLVLLMEPLRSIASLKKLRIEENDELVSFPNEAEQWLQKVTSSLSELVFSSLKSLESLPSSLESLSSLQKLYIGGVPMLRELPNLPPSLEYLTIRGCNPELKERYREDGGSDRHMIAHIPSIQSLFLLLFSCSALSTSIVAAMAEWFIGPIMDKIINTCSDYLEEQVGWQTGMKKELESLRQNHPKIQAVVFAANQAQISDQNHPINKWIWQLRDAVDEADDVLDDFEYMKHKEQLTKNMEETDQKRTANASFLIESASKIRKVGERALKIDPNLKRLEEIVQKLDKVSAGVSTFLHLLDSAKQEQQEQQRELYEARETGSLPTNDLIGRSEAKEFVMQWLRKPSIEHRTTLYINISLLSIVGHGGMGKTTLLQHVYEDEMTKEFDLKMWVCVSNNFDVKKIIADMLSTLKKERPRLDESLDSLQNSLRTEIMSKKFLLILDDIWEEEENQYIRKWEKVLAPLAYGKIGSQILVTTRMDSVAMMIAKVIKKKTEIFRLKGLEEDQCLQLLNSHAFADVDNPNDYERLRSIAGEIVKRLLGSPLAAKVIGGVLNSSLDERHWTKVLNSDFVSPKLGQRDIFLILRLSYMFLPKHLQNCFAFCSIFPQDYRFDKGDLVRMWISLGFIQQPHDQEWTMEDIGGMYFDVLVNKSFFDKFEDFGGYYYKMHDLIHELAQSVSIHECLRVEDSTKLPHIIPKTLRHLYVRTTNPDIIKKIGQFKYLHSLFLFSEASNQGFSALVEIFKTWKSLRLLYIHASVGLKMIPEEIENLIHLRYLKIDNCNLTMLPRSLSNLYHLQYIVYNKWAYIQLEGDDFLPSYINNLSNLRYVNFPAQCTSSICGIGKLKSLQELNMFYLRDVSGYRIGELENMNELCKLGINYLENVKDVEEASCAKLCAKRRLIDLTLCWSNTDSRNINFDENVLNNLRPPKCLRNLHIKRYMGASSAIWMNNVNLISNLEKINLSDCLECETLPPFGQLPFLKSLKLWNIPKVKWLESKINGNDKYRAFPLLEVLSIYRLEALEDWFEAGAAAEDGCFFPCLIELEIENCPKLKELPSLPPKLKRLSISNIGWTTLNFCSNSNPIPLQSLLINQCPNITSLPLSDEIARLAALRYLTIIKCPNLISLGRYREVESTNNCHLMLSCLFISDPSVLLMEPLRSIASLKTLSISKNDEVVSFPNEAEQWSLNVKSSLSVLQFSDLKSLESLPSSLESLSSLQKLSILNVRMLRELPNLPPSLERLEIWGCHPELKERYREDGGSDRHKIAHIPNIIISTKR